VEEGEQIFISVQVLIPQNWDHHKWSPDCVLLTRDAAFRLGACIILKVFRNNSLN
jgi:hypothetical protein